MMVHGCMQVASYMRAVLRTLAQCHSHHILHRDIKPGEKESLPGTQLLLAEITRLSG